MVHFLVLPIRKSIAPIFIIPEKLYEGTNLFDQKIKAIHESLRKWICNKKIWISVAISRSFTTVCIHLVDICVHWNWILEKYINEIIISYLADVPALWLSSVLLGIQLSALSILNKLWLKKYSYICLCIEQIEIVMMIIMLQNKFARGLASCFLISFFCFFLFYR